MYQGHGDAGALRSGLQGFCGRKGSCLELEKQAKSSLPGVAEAVNRIHASGYLAIVVTNQPVIARGEVTEEELQEIHNKMETLLGNEEAYLDAIYYCPYHPHKGYEDEVAELKTDCDCRNRNKGCY